MKIKVFSPDDLLFVQHIALTDHAEEQEIFVEHEDILPLITALALAYQGKGYDETIQAIKSSQ